MSDGSAGQPRFRRQRPSPIAQRTVNRGNLTGAHSGSPVAQPYGRWRIEFNLPLGVESRSERAATRNHFVPSRCCSTISVSRCAVGHPCSSMGNWTASHSGKRLFRLLALGARPGRWRCPLALGICRTCYRGGRAVFWNLPFNPAGARYLDKTRKWKLIRRGRSDPLGRCRSFS